jgi:hypothetical protein
VQTLFGRSSHISYSCTQISKYINNSLKYQNNCKTKDMKLYTHTYIYIYIPNAACRKREERNRTRDNFDMKAAMVGMCFALRLLK